MIIITGETGRFVYMELPTVNLTLAIDISDAMHHCLLSLCICVCPVKMFLLTFVCMSCNILG